MMEYYASVNYIDFTTEHKKTLKDEQKCLQNIDCNRRTYDSKCKTGSDEMGQFLEKRNHQGRMHL